VYTGKRKDFGKRRENKFGRKRELRT